MNIPRYDLQPDDETSWRAEEDETGEWCKWEDVEQALKEMKARTETVEPIASAADLRVIFPDESERIRDWQPDQDIDPLVPLAQAMIHNKAK